jgi:hypothetical protein
MQHCTRNTVETSEWCRKCGRNAMHRVDGVKLGACTVCLAKLDVERAAREAAPKPARQGELWGDES